MILYGILIAFFILVCILLIPLILIQQGKGSMGLGSLGGGSQMLFGGSGGQDIFQKTTWVLGALFIVGSLVLALMKASQVSNFAIPNKSVAPITQNKKAPISSPKDQ